MFTRLAWQILVNKIELVASQDSKTNFYYTTRRRNQKFIRLN